MGAAALHGGVFYSVVSVSVRNARHLQMVLVGVKVAWVRAHVLLLVGLVRSVHSMLGAPCRRSVRGRKDPLVAVDAPL